MAHTLAAPRGTRPVAGRRHRGYHTPDPPNDLTTTAHEDAPSPGVPFSRALPRNGPRRPRRLRRGRARCCAARSSRGARPLRDAHSRGARVADAVPVACRLPLRRGRRRVLRQTLPGSERSGLVRFTSCWWRGTWPRACRAPAGRRRARTARRAPRGRTSAGRRGGPGAPRPARPGRRSAAGRRGARRAR